MVFVRFPNILCHRIHAHVPRALATFQKHVHSENEADDKVSDRHYTRQTYRRICFHVAVPPLQQVYSHLWSNPCEGIEEHNANSQTI